MKKSQNILLILWVFMPLSLNIAFAASPELTYLPQQAQLNASPFKVVTIESDALTVYARSHYVSIDDPMNHETSVGTPMDGVAMLTLTRSDFTVDCTGTLLSTTTGDYVLTAANCVSDEFGNNNFVTGVATFTGVNGSETITITGVNIHPDWDGSIIRGNDVAILTLTHRPGAEINNYDIDRTNKFDVGSISEKIGYGLSLVFNDGRTSDTTPEIIDSSIGEFAGDTHVAIYASWIDSVTGGVSTSSDTTTQTKCNRRQQMLGNC